MTDTQPSITCPRCGATSYNPGDIANTYCGRCHWWTSDPLLGPHQPVTAAGVFTLRELSDIAKALDNRIDYCRNTAPRFTATGEHDLAESLTSEAERLRQLQSKVLAIFHGDR